MKAFALLCLGLLPSSSRAEEEKPRAQFECYQLQDGWQKKLEDAYAADFKTQTQPLLAQKSASPSEVDASIKARQALGKDLLEMNEFSCKSQDDEKKEANQFKELAAPSAQDCDSWKKYTDGYQNAAIPLHMKEDGLRARLKAIAPKSKAAYSADQTLAMAAAESNLTPYFDKFYGTGKTDTLGFHSNGYVGTRVKQAQADIQSAAGQITILNSSIAKVQGNFKACGPIIPQKYKLPDGSMTSMGVPTDTRAAPTSNVSVGTDSKDGGASVDPAAAKAQSDAAAAKAQADALKNKQPPDSGVGDWISDNKTGLILGGVGLAAVGGGAYLYVDHQNAKKQAAEDEEDSTAQAIAAVQAQRATASTSGASVTTATVLSPTAMSANWTAASMAVSGAPTGQVVKGQTLNEITVQLLDASGAPSQDSGQSITVSCVNPCPMAGVTNKLTSYGTVSFSDLNFTAAVTGVQLRFSSASAPKAVTTAPFDVIEVTVEHPQ